MFVGAERGKARPWLQEVSDSYERAPGMAPAPWQSSSRPLWLLATALLAVLTEHASDSLSPPH